MANKKHLDGLVEKERGVMGRKERGHEGSTWEENNGNVVFNEISMDQLGNRVMLESGGGVTPPVRTPFYNIYLKTT